MPAIGRVTPSDDAALAAPRGARRGRRPAASASSAPRPGRRGAGSASAAARGRARRRGVRPRDSTGAGGAPRTRDITAGAHEPRRRERARGGRSSTTSTPPARAGRAAAPATSAEAALRAVRVAARGDAGRRARRHVRAPRARGADFAAPDLDAELRAQHRRPRGRRRPTLGDPAIVGAGLARGARDAARAAARRRGACATSRAPTGSTSSRFELPLAGGDEPGGDGLQLDAIAALLREHLPPGDPLAGYAGAARATRRCASGARGYLTGSIDLVAARPAARFAVVDYKTNWLAGAGRGADRLALPARPRSRAEMQRAHYALQALLYTVALHRYLRWRLPGYDPERHLAGVLYLFLRGMTGPDTPRRRRRAVRRLRLAAAGARSSRRSATCSTGARRDRAPPTTRTTRAASRDAPGRCARSTTPASSRPPTSTSRCGWRRSRARRDRRGARARGRARRPRAAPRPRLRRPRDDRRARRRSTPTSPSTCRRCRGPSPRRGSRALAAQPARRGRRGRRARRPAAAARRHAPVPRPLLARGAPGRRRPARARRRRRGRRATRTCSPTASQRLFAGDDADDRQRLAAATAVAAPPRRSSPAARARARRRPSRASSRCSPSRPPARARRRRSSRSPRRPARPPRGSRRPCTPRPRALDVDDAIRAQLLALHGSTLHRLLGWRPGSHSRFRHHRAQPAAARRRGRRRDLDGVAVADGAARRGGAARRAAHPRRRPGPARVDRGGRGARRHRRPGAGGAADARAGARARSSRRPATTVAGGRPRPRRASATGSSCSTASTASAGASPRSPRRSARRRRRGVAALRERARAR